MRFVFNGRRWSGSLALFRMCKTFFPFSWAILFTIPPLKGLIKDSLCLGI